VNDVDVSVELGDHVGYGLLEVMALFLDTLALHTDLGA
jgi:hypothetical protein